MRSMLLSCCGPNHSLLSLTECLHAPFIFPHTYIQAVPGLFAALARTRLDRDMLLDKTRLVLAEKELLLDKIRLVLADKELEVTKARADAVYLSFHMHFLGVYPRPSLRPNTLACGQLNFCLLV